MAGWLIADVRVWLLKLALRCQPDDEITSRPQIRRTVCRLFQMTYKPQIPRRRELIPVHVKVLIALRLRKFGQRTGDIAARLNLTSLVQDDHLACRGEIHMNGLLANGDACYSLATIAKPITDRVFDIFEKRAWQRLQRDFALGVVLDQQRIRLVR